MVRVAQTLAELGAAGRPSREDAWRHVEGTGRSRVSKFEPCLPEGLSRELLVDGLLDVEGARRAVRQRATPSNDSHL